MADIHLHGALGQQFGSKHRFYVDSVPEVIDALRANFPGFIAAIRQGFYKVVLGKTPRNGLTLREDQLPRVAIAGRAIHIIPVAAGRKNGGLGKVIAGIALVGLSMVTGGAAGALMSQTLWTGGATIGNMVGNFGLAMMLTGVASMIAPEQSSGDTKESFTMSGPVSNMREGNILPIPYGEVVIGGYMISGSVVVDGPAGDVPPPAVANNPNNAAGGSLGENRNLYGGN